ncbi:MAG: glycosyltransferase family 4 protein [Bacteroidales bacterium]|nr:glycosyltransferase family 4 protein [Bacteroidales bacterium]
MKILLVTQYFYPETFRINDLADEFNRRGHNVTVLTGKPNYPSGKISNGYKWYGYQKEEKDGINIIRVPLIPRGNGNGMRLAINYVSFVFFSCLYILFNPQKYDISLTFAISPITQVYSALLHKFLHKSKAYIWVQDLWPESVIVAGNMNNKIIISILTKMVRFIYNNVDGILIQSKKFKDSIDKIGIYDKKIYYVPNWAEEIFENKANIDENKYKDLMPDGFKIMFAGNIGEAQDFPSLIKAVEKTNAYKTIQWVIIGDGRKREEMEALSKEKKLSNIHFLGQYPLTEMPSFFVHADAMLVTLKSEYIFSLTIPSKIQSYMAFGKPIVTMLDGIGNKIISEAKCGYTAEAGDYLSLSKNVILMSNLSTNDIYEMGKKSNKYYINNFSRNQVITSLIELFKKDI